MMLTIFFFFSGASECPSMALHFFPSDFFEIGAARGSLISLALSFPEFFFGAYKSLRLVAFRMLKLENWLMIILGETTLHPTLCVRRANVL